MRHRKRVDKLGRPKEHRDAMLRNQVISLFEHGRIRTTLQKAKAARKLAEKLITVAKKDDLQARRTALRYLTNKSAVNRLFHGITPLFEERSSGYTRILRMGPRRGDGAESAILELLEFPKEEEDKKAKKEKKTEKKAEEPSP
jgi:large subunit ribosomal protein L17